MKNAEMYRTPLIGPNSQDKAAEEVKGEGLVLWKNENKALPLTKGSKVSLLGTASVHFNYNTSGSSSTDSTKYVTLQDALTKEGFSINPALTDFYTNGVGKGCGIRTL